MSLMGPSRCTTPGGTNYGRCAWCLLKYCRADVLSLKLISSLLVPKPNYVSELPSELYKNRLQTYWIGCLYFWKVSSCFCSTAKFGNFWSNSFPLLLLKCCYRFKCFLFSDITFSWWFPYLFLIFNEFSVP